MRLFRLIAPVLLVASVAMAQAPPPRLNWYPQEIESLGQGATSRTEFSLDRSMLVLASKADDSDDSLRRVIAGIDGISIHRFHYPGEAMYDPAILSAVRHEYNEAGWQHVGNAHDKYGYPSGADVWIHLEHNTIRNIAVLFTGANQVNFISVSGSISPIDLLHLGGHFGIPRMAGGVAVARPYDSTPVAPPPPNDSDQQAPTNDPGN